MKRSQFGHEQFLAIVKEGEAGRKAADLARAHGITEQTYYRWKAKYGGMELRELQRIKQLEYERRLASSAHGIATASPSSCGESRADEIRADPTGRIQSRPKQIRAQGTTFFTHIHTRIRRR